MATFIDHTPTIVRTDRGLSIAGTRITLYTILDYLHDNWPPKLIQEWLQLTDTQMTNVHSYIAAHQDEVEAEYQCVVEQAAAIRQYWETRKRLTAPHPETLTPDQKALWKKLEAWKQRLNQA